MGNLNYVVRTDSKHGLKMFISYTRKNYRSIFKIKLCFKCKEVEGEALWKAWTFGTLR